MLLKFESNVLKYLIFKLGIWFWFVIGSNSGFLSFKSSSFNIKESFFDFGDFDFLDDFSFDFDFDNFDLSFSLEPFFDVFFDDFFESLSFELFFDFAPIFKLYN